MPHVDPPTTIQTDTKVAGADASDLGEVLDYLHTVGISLPQAINEPQDMAAIAPAVDVSLIAAELAHLPAENQLFVYRRYRVFCGTQEQMPHTLAEITRLRELTFRAMQEGSGQAVDTDEFDETYVHLLAWGYRNPDDCWRLSSGSHR